ncbi:hypothetical protein [Demequina sediminicola]|uniref:hypothetical protein n=1 Tax=Demequina sediminicola TaxID=1095026 RepID=UPI00078343A6|nr:hypothetical protein [Demequina sediminicola]
MPRSRQALKVWSVSAGALALMGCSGVASEPSGDGASAASEYQSESTLRALTGAEQDPRASDEQRQALTRWADLGITPYEDVALAVDRTFECFQVVGVEYTDLGNEGEGDFPEPLFSYDETAAAEGCIAQEYHYLSLAYQLGDGVSQSRERQAAASEVELRACLQALGVDVAEDSDFHALVDEVMESGDADSMRCVDEVMGG